MPDVLVIGAGIFGLATAFALARRGIAVTVLDRAGPGAGASGGPVGALSAHAPSRWRPMMAFQFQALLDLPARIAEIEALSGRRTGYARVGRLTALASPKDRAKAEAEEEAAPEVWGDRARFEVLDEVPEGARHWLAPGAAPHGVIRDTITARLDPRAVIAALAACPGIAIRPGIAVRGIGADGTVLTDQGAFRAGHVVAAAGWRTWDLVAPLMPALGGGQPVKGQAARLAAAPGPVPVITADGLYIIAHDQGGVAVGSTSEKRFADADATDAALDAVIARARRLCPVLAEAPVTERWAGLRPKPPGREPVAGPVPGHPGLWIAGGGYKIGFGIAHAIGDALAAMIAEETPALPLPDSFLPAHHGAATTARTGAGR